MEDDSDDDSFEGPSTLATHPGDYTATTQPSDYTVGSGGVAGENPEMGQLRQQMEGLEAMYTEVLKMLGVDREYLPGSRRSISSQSSISRTGRRHRSRSAHAYYHRHHREIKYVCSGWLVYLV